MAKGWFDKADKSSPDPSIRFYVEGAKATKELRSRAGDNDEVFKSLTNEGATREFESGLKAIVTAQDIHRDWTKVSDPPGIVFVFFVATLAHVKEDARLPCMVLTPPF